MIKKIQFFKKFMIAATLGLTMPGAIMAGTKTSVTYNEIDDKTKEINVNINLDNNDFVYQDFINISCDNPQIEIASWKTQATPIKHFSKEFRSTKNIFNKDFTIKIKTIKKTSEPVKNAHLHISYYLNSKNAIIEKIVPLDQNKKNQKNTSGHITENITRTVNGNDQVTISKNTNVTSKNFSNQADKNLNTKKTIIKDTNNTNHQEEINDFDYLQDQVNDEQDTDQDFINAEKIIGENINANVNTQDNKAHNSNGDITNIQNNNELGDSNITIDGAVNEKASNNTSNSNDSNNSQQEQSWTQYLQNLLKTSGSIWIRLLIALLLGVLLSLTPCIYPMIPITVGIIQSNGSKSFLSNLFLSIIYTMGIAITFAILGLVAAFTGAIFGTILASPVFVIILVSFMTYLALSMFGFYEIYMPKFMTSTSGASSNKSILSVFLLGIVSGTIASPCVSPGLILLLSIVTAIGSKLFGFLLLFAFGFGLGTPLIIAGTFSSSINKLPRAGMWMLEIKKLFGLLIFGVCFYFLGNIMPAEILSWIIAGFMMIVGAFYLYTIKPYDSKFWKLFKNIIGVIFCTASVMLVFNIYKDKYITQNLQSSQISNFWQEDFDKALMQAKQENKKLFIDLTTDTCSICKAIGKKVFTNSAITNEIKDKFVNVKVTVSDMSKEPFATLNKKFKILGFPTFLLIDPNNDAIIKKWSSEFYYMSEADLIKMFREIN